MKSLLAAASAAAFLALGASGAAHAGVLYTNGPINGTIDAWAVTGYAVEDSFTLTSTSTITGIEFGAAVYSGDQPLSVDWGIETSPTYVDQGTATLSTTLVNGNAYSGGVAVYQADFSIPSVTLAAGTYYLALQNGVTADGGQMFWDENDGPSTASQTVTGALGSESFSILGTASVPEPATWAMLLLGVAGLGLAMRRSRAALATA